MFLLLSCKITKHVFTSLVLQYYYKQYFVCRNTYYNHKTATRELYYLLLAEQGVDEEEVFYLSFKVCKIYNSLSLILEDGQVVT